MGRSRAARAGRGQSGQLGGHSGVGRVQLSLSLGVVHTQLKAGGGRRTDAIVRNLRHVSWEGYRLH